MMTMMGWASALMVAITMLAAVTLLPALLGIAGKRVNSLRVPFIKQKPAYNPQSKSARWAAKVVAKPVRYGAVAAIILGVLAVPVFSMRLGFPDAGNDSADDDHPQGLRPDGRRVRSRRQRPVVGRRRDRTGRRTTRPTLAAVGRALAADTGVASVDDARRSTTKKDLAVITVTPDHRAAGREDRPLLQRLRNDVLPERVGDSDVEASVTGGTAIIDDISERLQQRMPWFLGAVIGLAFLVLMLVFRSVLVPLKAALLNVLSVGAAYGVVVAVFQWGWGAEPDRRARDGADHAAGSDADVRDPVRSVDGLRGVPAQPGPRAVPAPPRPQARGRRGRRLDRAGHHQRGTDHDQRSSARSS